MTTDTRALPEQIADLAEIAIHAGMYDAAAWLYEQLSKGRASDVRWAARRAS